MPENEKDPREQYANWKAPEETRSAVTSERPQGETKENVTSKEFKEAGELQPWIDQSREQEFQKLTEFFDKVKETGGTEAVKNWFIDYINKNPSFRGRVNISSKDIESMDVVNVQSKSASQIAGADIVRPVVLFSNPEEYNRFMSLLGVESSDAVIMHRNKWIDDTFSKTGLIMSKMGEQDNVSHEIRHSIDPHVESRRGYDHVLTEAAAWYQYLIVDGGDQWKGLEDMLSNYKEKVERFYGMSINDADWRRELSKIVDTIHKVHDQYGPLETNRILFQSKNMTELRNRIQTK